MARTRFPGGNPMKRHPRQSRPSGDRYIPLFWRLLIPNASVLTAACVVLIVEPANGRVVALVGGLLVMLVINVVLMRRAFAPLSRLTSLMDAIDPLEPGRRIPPLGPQSEATTLAESFNGMVERLETERRDSARRALAGQEAERRHVAAELHDEIGQTLTALVMQLDRLERRVPGEARAEVSDAVATARASLEEVRALARRLRPEVLDELGLIPALGNLCDRLSHRTGLAITRTLPSRVTGIEDDAQLVIYRVVQESLTNVVRHAGATRAEVTLGLEGHGIELCVDDDGVGLPEPLPAGDGGIRSMRERALLVGGRLSLGTSASGGTRVRLHLRRTAPASAEVDGETTDGRAVPADGAGSEDSPAALALPTTRDPV